MKSEVPRPLEDADEALEMIRGRSKESKVDPGRNAACGFSAGGHLAAALGTMGKIRPNALVLAYPCILEAMSEILPWPVPSLVEEVDGKTPPPYLYDRRRCGRSVENSLELA